MSRHLWTRRRFLKGLGLGAGVAGLGLGQIASLFPRRAAAGTAIANKLVCVFCDGGIRSIDFCDAYPSATKADDGYDVTGYNLTSECTDMGVGDWYLPPAASRLPTDKMALVRHVNMETASHALGPLIGLTGQTRGGSPGIPVAIANALGGGTFPGGVSFNRSVYSAPGYKAPISGDPAVINALLSPVSGLADSDLWRALNTHNNATEGNFKTTSRLHAWLENWELSEDIVRGEGRFEGLLDTTQDVEIDGVTQALYKHYEDNSTRGAATTDDHAHRFAGAELALSSGLADVATIWMTGFDTHQESQQALCEELCNMLALLMERLGTEDTIYLVMSDFDRTPAYNASEGSDHWFYGSVPVFGAGISGPAIYGANPARGNYPGVVELSDIDAESADTRGSIWANVLNAFGIDYTEVLPLAVPVCGLFGIDRSCPEEA
ncbi:MAG: DUF1501 domain-containing protein [Chromatiales bacterium]|nr:DUF1501 domain-containing protein [Gammaproteobacteria bacterium]MCP5353157.1 DUF1501 domain-containing protein [Chromatiales bacterium]